MGTNDEFVKAMIQVVIDEEGRVYFATEKGKHLEYGKDEIAQNKTIDDCSVHLKSNPCCWRRRRDG